MPGTGKSTLAKALCKEFNAIRISSDRIRKGSGTPDYSEEGREEIYKKMVGEAAKAIMEGVNVVADGTFSKESWRKEMEKIAPSNGCFLVLCTIPKEDVRKRIMFRKNTESDADYEVYLKLEAKFEKPEDFIRVDSKLPLRERVIAVKKAIKWKQKK